MDSFSPSLCHIHTNTKTVIHMLSLSHIQVLFYTYSINTTFCSSTSPLPHHPPQKHTHMCTPPPPPPPPSSSSSAGQLSVSLYLSSEIHPCTHIYVCTHIHTCAHTNTYTHIRANTYTHTRIHKHIHTNMPKHQQAHTLTQAHTDIQTHMCTHTQSNTHTVTLQNNLYHTHLHTIFLSPATPVSPVPPPPYPRRPCTHLLIVVAVVVSGVLDDLLVGQAVEGLVTGKGQDLPEGDSETPHVWLSGELALWGQWRCM